jgi:hypothetical protein
MGKAARLPAYVGGCLKHAAEAAHPWAQLDGWGFVADYPRSCRMA